MKSSRLNNKILGDAGEMLALAVYLESGYKCLEHSWSTATGEIDLIVARNNLLVFVEVKFRSSNYFGSAASSVDWRKQAQVRKTAQQWLAQNSEFYSEIRFDVATVDLENRVEIIEACF